MASEGEIINLQGGNPGSRRDNPININHYATKKSVAESMLDVALFMANVTQLKAVLEQGPSFQYYATLAALISISLFFQVVIGILLIIMVRINLNDVSKQLRLNEFQEALLILESNGEVCLARDREGSPLPFYAGLGRTLRINGDRKLLELNFNY
ncbi:ninjurin-2 [Alligator mississippiensis]|uniref:Ninjurin-2 n=1 Tax=Alligator mississippiensis TaxID=8496 RepID=A0A151NIG4_ALLMI|nr:ninjurin-2 [Alligator mississippiensis]